MIPILIGIGIVILIAKNRSDALSNPALETVDGGISHTYSANRPQYVTERMPVWGTFDQFNFIRTTAPLLPTGGAQPTETYPAAISNIRIGGISRLSGGGSFQ